MKALPWGSVLALTAQCCGSAVWTAPAQLWGVSLPLIAPKQFVWWWSDGSLVCGRQCRGKLCRMAVGLWLRLVDTPSSSCNFIEVTWWLGLGSLQQGICKKSVAIWIYGWHVHYEGYYSQRVCCGSLLAWLYNQDPLNVATSILWDLPKARGFVFFVSIYLQNLNMNFCLLVAKGTNGVCFPCSFKIIALVVLDLTRENQVLWWGGHNSGACVVGDHSYECCSPTTEFAYYVGMVLVGRCGISAWVYSVCPHMTSELGTHWQTMLISPTD